MRLAQSAECCPQATDIGEIHFIIQIKQKSPPVFWLPAENIQYDQIHIVFPGALLSNLDIERPGASGKRFPIGFTGIR